MLYYNPEQAVVSNLVTGGNKGPEPADGGALRLGQRTGTERSLQKPCILKPVVGNFCRDNIQQLEVEKGRGKIPISHVITLCTLKSAESYLLQLSSM